MIEIYFVRSTGTQTYEPQLLRAEIPLSFDHRRGSGCCFAFSLERR